MAGWQDEFDTRGNNTKTTYFGVNGKLTMTTDGLAVILDRFDSNNNHAERSYFDASNKPIVNICGYAGRTQLFDYRGNEIDRSFYGIKGKPVNASFNKESKYAREIRKFNKHGQLVFETRYETEGFFALNDLKAYAVRYEYDSNGSLENKKLLDLDDLANL